MAQGALALTATLDLQIAAGLNKQFRAAEALRAARRSTDASRRFQLATLPMALIFQATAHAIRGEEREMEAMITEAVALAPDDQDVLGCAWGHCRATLSLLSGDIGEAHAQMATGAGLLLSSPATIAPPFLGLWPLLGALLDRNAADAAARVRAAHGTRHLVVGALLGYADAVLAGRQGRPGDAETVLGAADARMGQLVAWYRQYARRLAAEAALADGWGEPVSWLREAAAYFAARGDDRVAAACRSLLRQAGAPVPRHRTGDGELPGSLRALGVTEREADVLRLVAQGLGNREIAERMFLSPRRALAAMVAGYPGQHWLGQDPHRQIRQPIDGLEGVAVPVLVAVGERDVPGFREMSAVLARRMPAAACRVVPNAGHMINMEQPAAVNALLTRFVLDALRPCPKEARMKAQPGMNGTATPTCASWTAHGTRGGTKAIR